MEGQVSSQSIDAPYWFTILTTSATVQADQIWAQNGLDWPRMRQSWTYPD